MNSTCDVEKEEREWLVTQNYFTCLWQHVETLQQPVALTKWPLAPISIGRILPAWAREHLWTRCLQKSRDSLWLDHPGWQGHPLYKSLCPMDGTCWLVKLRSSFCPWNWRPWNHSIPQRDVGTSGKKEGRMNLGNYCIGGFLIHSSESLKSLPQDGSVTKTKIQVFYNAKYNSHWHT